MLILRVSVSPLTDRHCTSVCWCSAVSGPHASDPELFIVLNHDANSIQGSKEGTVEGVEGDLQSRSQTQSAPQILTQGEKR